MGLVSAGLPERVDRVAVAVSQPGHLPAGVRRVTVSVYRAGMAEPVQVVSYVYP